jgi:transposase
MLVRAKEQAMLRLLPISAEHLSDVQTLYRTTKDVRLRTRAQIILLALDGMSAPTIATIVRLDPESVRHHLLRFQAEGVAGLADRPRSGRPPRVTPSYLDAALTALRRRPRALNLPFSLWTLPRLLDYLEVQTGLRVSDETLRVHLRAHGISFSQPQHKVTSPDPDYVQKKRRLKQRETN